MSLPNDHPLIREIHQAEREIEALESKIQFADLKTTYPSEYEQMRSAQEQYRQHILRCKTEIDKDPPLPQRRPR